MGISLGWELGIGMRMAQGVMLDAAVEAAIRLGKNFRLIARLCSDHARTLKKKRNLVLL